MAGVVAAAGVILTVGTALYRNAPPLLTGLTTRPFDMQFDFRANATGGIFLNQPLVVDRSAITDAGMSVDGWVFDVTQKGLASGVYVSVNGTRDFAAAYGIIRPDLVAHFSDRRYLQAGFSALVPLDALPAGEHLVTLKVVGADGRAYAESKPQVVIVK
jgi:hypothetical protein